MPICTLHQSAYRHVGPECDLCLREIYERQEFALRLKGVAADLENAIGDLEESPESTRREHAVTLLDDAQRSIEKAAAVVEP
jgi:hypothetical protein